MAVGEVEGSGGGGVGVGEVEWEWGRWSRGGREGDGVGEVVRMVERERGVVVWTCGDWGKWRVNGGDGVGEVEVEWKWRV